MSKRPQPQPKQLTRKQISRREQEQQFARRVVIGAAAVLAAVVLILAWGLIDLHVLKPRKPVATVAGVPIRLAAYQKLLKYRRYDYHSYVSNLEQQRLQYAAGEEDMSYVLQIIDQQIAYVESEISYLPSTVLEELIDDEITRQECAIRGIVVTQDEVQLNLEQQFGYERNTPTPTVAPLTATLPITITPTETPMTATLPITLTPSPTLTPTTPMTYDEFTSTSREWFAQIRKATGFDEQDYRRLVESSLYRQKLEKAIGDQVPLTAEQVHAVQILVNTQEEADAVVARLKAGEDWDALAAELSQDYATQDTGGALGWFPKGKKGDAFDEAVFALEPDPTNTLVVQDDSGFHVVRVLERDATRYLSEEDLDTARQQAVNDWLTARQGSEDIVRLLDYNTMVPDDPYQSTTS